ncbi:MAG: hypothetical protein NZ455_11625 [Bacteroidia bacterium]|nr:hypothetical protein [Bacteroidia bacterium]MDW8347602.1 hypothetical protein [Bacteroidia bacterium]
MKSLDPRINRFNIENNSTHSLSEDELEQWQTFEVFHQKKPDEPHIHVGAVHASNADVAFLFAKEQYARRLQCYNLWLAKTADIYAYNLEKKQNDNFNSQEVQSHPEVMYDIFYQISRGEHPKYTGTVIATHPDQAIQEAQKNFGSNSFMIWAIPQDKIYKQPIEQAEMYAFAPKKSYRDATGYKVMAKLNKIRKQKKQHEQK